ncbi:hypothetical protein CMI47_12795 [Candidatus Pacearchaeota archaeon]|nr:hypothetical protein [Candidatus Pacearchaeota archaeon]|tara:strand:+ start:55065 stop:56429 length:1365 start_codon:yes stop_codon:yes gene_type:complete
MPDKNYSVIKNLNKNLREEVIEKTDLVKKFFSLGKKYRLTISGEEFVGESHNLFKLAKEKDHIQVEFLDIEGFSKYGYEVSIYKRRKKDSLKSFFEARCFVNGGVLHITFSGAEFYNYTICHQNDKTEVQYNVWLVQEDKLKLFGSFLKEFKEFKRILGATEKLVTVYGGENYTVNNLSYDWEDIILPLPVKDSIRESVDFWYNNETWYRERKFPYKRGVLIHGYPGNGKTFLTKIIISQYDLNIVQFNFGNPQLGNADLTRAFKTAKENAPSLFLLEDIDRIFSKHEKQISGVTKDCLFNCLDGVEELDGVLVLATANYPEDLDSAFLNRPSRFDTIIELSVPSLDLRFEYLKKLFEKDLKDDDTIAHVARHCDGMSMAFMKEIYFKSVIIALSTKQTLNSEHIEEALNQCLTHYNTAITKKSERSAGFTSNKGSTKVPNINISKQPKSPMAL